MQTVDKGKLEYQQALGKMCMHITNDMGTGSLYHGVPISRLHQNGNGLQFAMSSGFHIWRLSRKKSNVKDEDCSKDK